MNGSQTEDMKRLILDGKIVGYESRKPVDSRARQIEVMRKRVNEDEWYSLGNPFAWIEDWLYHDSFDTGIKVGDEWWFENDIIQFGYGGEVVEGVLYFTGCLFGIEYDNHVVDITVIFSSITKRIGTIYDKEK